MLSKCSNPCCSVPFRYLRHGELFRLEADPKRRSGNPGRMEYFWLCGGCSSKMSLRISQDGRVMPVMVPVVDSADFNQKGITLVDRRDGLLLSQLGFAQTGHGTGAVFFG
jgi:hypothetical protein